MHVDTADRVRNLMMRKHKHMHILYLPTKNIRRHSFLLNIWALAVLNVVYYLCTSLSFTLSRHTTFL